MFCFIFISDVVMLQLDLVWVQYNAWLEQLFLATGLF